MHILAYLNPKIYGFSTDYVPHGSREDCVAIKTRRAEFIASALKMELSAEKTLITHYYSMASNFNRLDYFAYLMAYGNDTFKRTTIKTKDQTLRKMQRLIFCV